MFARLRAAITAFRTAGQTPTSSAPQQTNDVGGDISGTAFQGRDFHGDISTGPTHHHGQTSHYGQGATVNHVSDQSTVTNNNNGGNVGMQLGHVGGGVFNVGGTNSITGSAIGHGATVNNVGQNNGGQVFSAGRIDGGVHFGR